MDTALYVSIIIIIIIIIIYETEWGGDNEVQTMGK